MFSILCFLLWYIFVNYNEFSQLNGIWNEHQVNYSVEFLLLVAYWTVFSAIWIATLRSWGVVITSFAAEMMSSGFIVDLPAYWTSSDASFAIRPSKSSTNESIIFSPLALIDRSGSTHFSNLRMLCAWLWRLVRCPGRFAIFLIDVAIRKLFWYKSIGFFLMRKLRPILLLFDSWLICLINWLIDLFQNYIFVQQMACFGWMRCNINVPWKKLQLIRVSNHYD